MLISGTDDQNKKQCLVTDTNMFDYSITCECGHQDSPFRTLNEARTAARQHLKTHNDRTPNWSAMIDQHEVGGDLTDRDWKIIKNH